MNSRLLTEMVAQRRAAAERLAWMDANSWLGRAQGFPLTRELNALELSASAEAHHIRGGLVSHWLGCTVSPQVGNQALLDEIDTLKYGLIWTGLPLAPAEDGPLPGSGELPACVRGVRVFPGRHGFPLTGWCLRSLCDVLVDRRLPLFVWHTEIDWTQLHQFAREFPGLAIIVESQPQKIIYHARPLLGLMRDCLNVHLEISNVTGPLFDIVLRAVGPQRLVYGSFMPVNDPRFAMGLVLGSGLAESDQAMIAGGNLARLTGGTSA